LEEWKIAGFLEVTGEREKVLSKGIGEWKKVLLECIEGEKIALLEGWKVLVSSRPVSPRSMLFQYLIPLRAFS
jgi:hypothetical protein